MRDFDHEGPPRVVFGQGAESRVSELLDELGATRVLVVATARHREGAERVHAQLGARSVGIWDEARPQVPAATAEAIVQCVRDTGADWVLAHGGGTAIGAAKAAALETDVRIAAVPTTYSGSEMTPIWGITRDGVKRTGRDERVRPRLVVFDPDLYAALSREVTATSLYNALAHSIDGLFDATAADDVHDDAERSVGAIVSALRRLARDPDDAAARRDAVFGAHLAGRVLGSAQMALHHKLAHVLGGSFGTPHAATHATLLPYTAAFNQAAAPQALERLRRTLGHADPGAALHDLSHRLGLPTRLSELGFQRADVPRAVELALSQRYPNPRELTAEGLTQLLSDAVHGRRPSARNARLPLVGHGPHADLLASRRGPSLASARGVVLAVHGRGSNADAFIERLAPHVDTDVAILAPQADDCTWYPASFRDVERNEAHLASALSILDAAFELAAAAVGPGRVTLVGFSQGACLAVSWLAHRKGRARPDSAALWSGAHIPGYGAPGDLSGMPVFVSAASRDPWVELDEAKTTAELLRQAGASVELAVTDTDEHTIRPNDIEALRRLLETTIER